MKQFEDYSATEIVLHEIQNGAAPEDFEVASTSLTNYLNYLLGRRDVPLSIIAELAGVNRATFYKVLSGSIRPSRNLIIRLGLELLVSFEEMQYLLKISGCAALSGTRKRDVFIINAVVNHQSIGILDEQLQRNNLDSIFAR